VGARRARSRPEAGSPSKLKKSMGHKIMSSSIHEGVLPYVCIYYYSKGERIKMVISAKCDDIDGNPRIWASFDDPIYKKKTIQLYDCSTIVKAKCMFCFMEKDGLFSRLLIAIVHCKVPAVVITYSAMQSACPRQGPRHGRRGTCG
jgi:hypothetical protein